jgi:hypothetical protein
MASSSDIPSTSKTIFVKPIIPEPPSVSLDKWYEVIGGDVLVSAKATQKPPLTRMPPICHHCGLSGHIRPQCSLLKAQRSKVKKELPRQTTFGTRHGIRLLSINGISSDLFLPIRMVNRRKTNQGTTRISRRSLRMINSVGSCLYGCKVWYGEWITRWRPVNNHHQEGRHGSEMMKLFTPWGGMDKPRWWGYTCLGFGS